MLMNTIATAVSCVKTKTSRAVRVNAKVQYHFPGAAAATFARISDDTRLSLQIRVTKDTQRPEVKHSLAEKMGKLYWDARKLEYEKANDKLEFSNLVILDEKEPKDEAMKTALKIFLKHNAKCEDLDDWAAMCTELSQRNFTVLMKNMWHVYPGLNHGIARVALTILKMIHLLGLQIRKPNLMLKAPIYHYHQFRLIFESLAWLRTRHPF